MGNRQDILLEIKNARKEFPGVIAVNDVSFSIRKGEVHIVIGENGAGKSTLVKMIAGVYSMDGGELILDGERFSPQNVLDARKAGISMIHQELSMMSNRTVAQNIFVGREPLKWGCVVDVGKMNHDCKVLLDSLGISIHPTRLVKDLSIAQQQMVEVAKALSTQNRLLIMDEPTSSLTFKEIAELFRITRKLRDEGVSIVYISHRMNELFEIGDRVTVMRDGCFVSTRNVGEVELPELITMMVGRRIENVYNRTFNEPGTELLRVENLTGLRFRNISFSIRAGEIVGFSGLAGAGRTELAKAIFGYDPILGGLIHIEGQAVRTRSHRPAVSVSRHMALLPEDRKKEGLFLNMSIKDNIILSSLKQQFQRGRVRKEVVRRIADEKVKELRIMTTSINKKVYYLSGGNQQKVVLAKWLTTDSRVFVFDEPTRGIDVGAKAEIYHIMNELARKGAGIMMISSEMLELIGVADRILVMKDGEITGEVSQKDLNFSQERLLSLGIEGR